MCRCIPIQIAKLAIYFLSSLVGLIAAAVIGVAIMFKYSESYKMIEEETDDVALYLFVMILVLGLIILMVAACGCLAAKKDTKFFVFSFGVISLFFMIFMLLVGIIVVEANRYIVEVIEDDNGEADAGLLALIPGFSNTSFTINAEDRAKYRNVNRYMCGAICPCPAEHKELYTNNKKLASNYKTAVFTPISATAVDVFYPECYERLLVSLF